jgi:transglutaminase-like putative cysteine protease
VPVKIVLPQFGAVEVEQFPASPDDDRSVAETIALMGSVIEASATHPAIIQATREACASLGQSAPAWRQCQAVFSFIKGRVRFMTDEAILARYFNLGPDFELLIKPELLLAFGRGDCDCHAMLTCAMLRCAGVDCRLVTIAADRDQPARYSHVYAAAVLESGELLAMDTSHGVRAGWEAPWCFRRQEWGPA